MDFFLILLAAALLALLMWLIPTRRTLAMLDENSMNAMGQIGVQLSARWDALSTLLSIAKNYAELEHKSLSQAFKERRPVNAKSTPAEAAEQYALLRGATNRIIALSERYPSLKADEGYAAAINNLSRCEGMARQCCLTYNDSVTRLNRDIRMFPTKLIAGVLGFTKREYLEMGASFSESGSAT